MTLQSFTLDDVFVQLANQMEIINSKPLAWSNDPTATIGEIIGWRKETIWVRSTHASEGIPTGVMRVATLEFTVNQELREDQYNCPLICSLVGTEVVHGEKQVFTFEILPRGLREHIRIMGDSDFLVIGKIIILFHAVWGSFKLNDFTPSS